MGNKINKKLKIILIILGVIVIILTTYVFVNLLNEKKQEKSLKQIQEKVSTYTTISDFQTIEEVFVYLDTTYINMQECEDENIEYIINIKSKYELNLNEKNYFEKLIHYSATVLKYKNFVIKDEEKKIEIVVLCNEENELISEYIINNQRFYFDQIESEKNVENYSKTEITKIKNNSELIENIISNNWKTTNLELGTKTSTFKGYDIYFEEGYEIRKVNGKIFNMVFTSKYNKEIIEDLKVNSKQENIIKTLGNPTFEIGELIGYKTEKFYIFFYTNQVSIYPIIEYDNNDLIKIKNLSEQYKDETNITTYINGIKKIWQDYNVLDSNGEYIILQYVLKGIEFKYDNSSKKGIILYKNYLENFAENTTLETALLNKINLVDNVYFVNEDFVFLQEQKRIESLPDCSEYRNYSINNVVNISKKFKMDITANTVQFISINSKCANSELRETMNYGIWLDDSNFIYSVSNRGIYIYNAENYTYRTLIEGKGEFKLTEINNGKLYYDSGEYLEI